jgi:hypothetical protein
MQAFVFPESGLESMVFIRKWWWFAVVAMWIGSTATVRAQDLQPFGPVPAGNLTDAQLFAPADISTYGDFPRPNIGPWFSYQRVYLSIHQPAYALIGNPSPVAAGLSDADNQFIKGGYDWGNRFDLGYMVDENHGWETSILKTNDQISTFDVSQSHIGFLNSTGGAETLTVGIEKDYKNVTRLTGVELMKVYRYDPDDNWGVWEVSVGARMLQVHDRFDSVPGPLEAGGLTTSWDLGIDNNIVGPQIGARWWNQRGRWIFDAEARFMPGANFQNASLYGSLININPLPEPITSFDGKLDTVQFAPVGEVRFESSVKITDAISLKVGYSALAMTGIGRASRRIDYTLPNMGIINGAKNDHLVANGVTFGFEINR